MGSPVDPSSDGCLGPGDYFYLSPELEVDVDTSDGAGAQQTATDIDGM